MYDLSVTHPMTHKRPICDPSQIHKVDIVQFLDLSISSSKSRFNLTSRLS